jgi:hypothetical protein
MNCILLLANYRTGSSSYSHVLANRKILEYPEPHLFPEKWASLQEAVDSGKKFVIKFMPDQIEKFELYQKIVKSNCYKIKLIRENKLEQIASYYVASMTDIWNDHSNEFKRGKEYTVNISLDQIKTSINIITNNDFLLENLDIKFDNEVTYERLVEQGLLTSGTVKLTTPTNYKIIKQRIEYEYNKSR